MFTFPQQCMAIISEASYHKCIGLLSGTLIYDIYKSWLAANVVVKDLRLEYKDKDFWSEDKDLRLKYKDFWSEDNDLRLKYKDKDLWSEDKDLRLEYKDLWSEGKDL